MGFRSLGILRGPAVQNTYSCFLHRASQGNVTRGTIRHVHGLDDDLRHLHLLCMDNSNESIHIPSAVGGLREEGTDDRRARHRRKKIAHFRGHFQAGLSASFLHFYKSSTGIIFMTQHDSLSAYELLEDRDNACARISNTCLAHGSHF